MSGWLEAGAYLAGFAMGTILAMILFSGLLGLLGQKTGASATRAFRRVFGGASAVALVAGIVWTALAFEAAGG